MAGRPKKETIEAVVEDKVVEEVKVDTEKEELKEQNKKMAEMMEQMTKQMEMMQMQLNTSTSPSKDLITKKVKCINLANHPLNVSTEPNGKGRPFSFLKYGESKLIKFDDLSDIVTSYPNTVKSGMFYISSKEAIEELGLEEEYESIMQKKDIDKIVRLREDTDVDLFLGMNDFLQKSTATKIAEAINANEKYDLNRLGRIKNVTGIDIEELAKDMKEVNVKM